MTWVYFLKAKSEDFEKFVNFQHMVENETREKVASLRTDNGGEFTSTEFNDYCRNNGIMRQLTSSYTPQQNGVTERMNRTLMGMARSMMQFKGLSTKYWAEAVHTVVYLRNRSPTSALDGQTPYEAWYGFKPKVNHLRVFGSTCYALVPKEKRTKLENRSMKCNFIGYSEEKKGYRLLSDGKFIVSRDVIFL
jgi:IS30 family transposase